MFTQICRSRPIHCCIVLGKSWGTMTLGGSLSIIGFVHVHCRWKVCTHACFFSPSFLLSNMNPFFVAPPAVVTRTRSTKVGNPQSIFLPNGPPSKSNWTSSTVMEGESRKSQYYDIVIAMHLLLGLSFWLISSQTIE